MRPVSSKLRDGRWRTSNESAQGIPSRPPNSDSGVARLPHRNRSQNPSELGRNYAVVRPDVNVAVPAIEVQEPSSQLQAVPRYGHLPQPQVGSSAMTFELIFTDRESGRVTFAITEVAVIRWITQSEIGMTMLNGRLARCRFGVNEKLEIERKSSREKHSL